MISAWLTGAGSAGVVAGVVVSGVVVSGVVVSGVVVSGVVVSGVVSEASRVTGCNCNRSADAGVPRGKVRSGSRTSAAACSSVAASRLTIRGSGNR